MYTCLFFSSVCLLVVRCDALRFSAPARGGKFDALLINVLISENGKIYELPSNFSPLDGILVVWTYGVWVDERLLHVVAVLVADHALEHAHVAELQIVDDQITVVQKLPKRRLTLNRVR